MRRSKGVLRDRMWEEGMSGNDEIADVEARHGKALKGLLERYFK